MNDVYVGTPEEESKLNTPTKILIDMVEDETAVANKSPQFIEDTILFEIPSAIPVQTVGIMQEDELIEKAEISIGPVKQKDIDISF